MRKSINWLLAGLAVVAIMRCGGQTKNPLDVTAPSSTGNPPATTNVTPDACAEQQSTEPLISDRGRRELSPPPRIALHGQHNRFSIGSGRRRTDVHLVRLCLRGGHNSAVLCDSAECAHGNRNSDGRSGWISIRKRDRYGRKHRADGSGERWRFLPSSGA